MTDLTVKVTPDAIVSLAARGKVGLQVPHLAIDVEGEVPVVYDMSAQPEAIDVPAAWFVYLKDGRRAVLGKETGFLFLTRLGYEANKPALRAAFEGAGGEWSRFEEAAEKELELRQAALCKEMKNLEARLAQAQKILKGGAW